MKRILSLLMAAVTSLSLAACSADTPEESQYQSQVVSADYAAASPDAAEESQPTEEQSATVADSAPSAEAAQSTTAVSTSAATPETAEGSQPESLPEDGTYSSRDDVALYIHTYGHLPGNFITKKEARELGWSGGSVEEYAPGKCIGGDHFGNYEGLLPEKSGRSYTECDIDTLGSSGRGAKRIIFSNDGLIYYTDDHYASFTLLYGEE